MNSTQIFESMPPATLTVVCPDCIRRRLNRTAAQRSRRARARVLRPPLRPTGIDKMLILMGVAFAFGVTTTGLISARRDQHISAARFAAMFLLYELSGESYPQIGRFLGKRNHTTIIHGCRQVALRMAGDSAYKSMIDQIRSTIVKPRREAV